MNLLPKKADWLDARRAPLTDLAAGLTVAIVALPLALAFGIASGLGAEAGLTTAIIAGAIAASLGMLLMPNAPIFVAFIAPMIFGGAMLALI